MKKLVIVLTSLLAIATSASAEYKNKTKDAKWSSIKDFNTTCQHRLILKRADKSILTLVLPNLDTSVAGGKEFAAFYGRVNLSNLNELSSIIVGGGSVEPKSNYSTAEINVSLSLKKGEVAKIFGAPKGRVTSDGSGAYINLVIQKTDTTGIEFFQIDPKYFVLQEDC